MLLCCSLQRPLTPLQSHCPILRDGVSGYTKSTALLPVCHQQHSLMVSTCMSHRMPTTPEHCKLCLYQELVTCCQAIPPSKYQQSHCVTGRCVRLNGIHIHLHSIPSAQQHMQSASLVHQVTHCVSASLPHALFADHQSLQGGTHSCVMDCPV